MAGKIATSEADLLIEKWIKADAALSLERRDFWLNLAFFQGDQWVFWHASRNELATFPRPKDSERVRLTINKIQPNLVTLMGKLLKRMLAFEVMATDAGDDAVAGARLAEAVLEAYRVDRRWEDIRYDTLFNSFTGDASAIAVEWDGSAGTKLGVDQSSGKVIGTGDVQLTALSIPEFTLEPGTRRAEDARWWMMAKALPAEQVKAKYHMTETPDADGSAAYSPLQRRVLEDRNYPINIPLTTVYTYYERPNPETPEGRFAVIVNKKTVASGKWPFPFKDRLNVQVFRCVQLPMRWTGHTIVSDARPLQAAYNLARSNISEHMKLAGAAKLAIPDNLPDRPEDWTDEPGEFIEYDGMSGAKPFYLEPPQLARWLIQESDRIAEELDDIMFVHDISRGDAPGDRNSGIALSVLSEKDETPLGIMARDQATGWGQVAGMVLELLQSKVEAPRTVQIQTPAGISVPSKWTGKMLRGQTRVSVPLDNVLPHSRAALQAWLLNLVQYFPQMAAGLTGPSLSRMLDMPGTALLGEIVDADVAKADAENHRMIAGEICLPALFDNHAVHIAEHNRMRKSKGYEFADRATQSILDQHVKAHEHMAQEEALAQRSLNQAMPGAAALPQAHEPVGSVVPADFQERQASAGVQANGGGAGPSASPPGQPPGMV